MTSPSTDPLLARLASHPLEPVLRLVGEQAAELGIDVCAVGGFVRDFVLERATPDVDFVTIGPGTGIELARAVARKTGGSRMQVYESFGTAAIRIPSDGVDLVLEFVAARRESYRADSRKPRVEDATREEDLLRRDFRVNAMALDLAPDRFGTLIDPLGGMQDLAVRMLRTPLDPERTFDDDPLRMMRAARFAAQLDFEVDPDALAAMRLRAGRIGIVSAERIRDELQRIVCASRPSIGFRVLRDTGVLPFVLPELSDLEGVETVDGQRHKDNFYHTLQVVDNLVDATAGRACSDTEWLRWAALLHDVGKTSAKRFVRGTGWTFHGHEERGARMVKRLFRRLKLPLDERMERVQKLIRLHHRPVSLVDESVTDSAVRRLLFDAGDDVDDLMVLVRADITSKNPERVRRYLKNFDIVDRKMVEVEEKDRLRNFQPPVDGHEIMETLGIREGLAVGILKNAIREAILDGEIPNEHDPAHAFMMARKDDAIRRGRLFDTVVARLSGPRRRFVGAVKEAVMDTDLPDDDREALAFLESVASPSSTDTRGAEDGGDGGPDDDGGSWS